VDIAGCYSTVMLFGLTKPDARMEIKPFQLFKKEITVKASFINPYTFERAKALIGSGKIDVTSMIYGRPSVEELPGILADEKARVAGKYVVML
jgi:threonine dehydrogenase-like Zn-dependent dehydrogenase